MYSIWLSENLQIIYNMLYISIYLCEIATLNTYWKLDAVMISCNERERNN